MQFQRTCVVTTEVIKMERCRFETQKGEKAIVRIILLL